MKNKSALAPRGSAMTYTVRSSRLEPPRGSEFTVAPGPVEDGRLAVIAINGFETVGRHYRNVAGFDLVILPGLMIQVTDPSLVRVVGPIALDQRR